VVCNLGTVAIRLGSSGSLVPAAIDSTTTKVFFTDGLPKLLL
jgi:hypothetical protein